MKWEIIGHIIASWCPHCHLKQCEALKHMSESTILAQRKCLFCDRYYEAPTKANLAKTETKRG